MPCKEQCKDKPQDMQPVCKVRWKEINQAVNDGDYNFSGVGLGDSFGDISKISELTDNGYTWDDSYGTVEMFSNEDVSVSFFVDGTIYKIQAMVIDDSYSSDYTEDISKAETISETDNNDYNTKKIEISDIFYPYDDNSISWKLSNGQSTYYMIPIISDKTNKICFNATNELYGYAEVYYIDVESIGETDNGGLTAMGTMYTNTNSPVYNGKFMVTWDSYEAMDLATVELLDGTEMTDTSMVGDYYYYGYVGENVGDSNEYIFPDSDSRYLTQDDVAGMDAVIIRLGINEIYARHGRKFEAEDLNKYFSSKSWYTPIYSQEEFAAIEGSVFNEYEKANITFLGALRDSLNGQASSFTPNWIYGTYGGSSVYPNILIEIGYYTDGSESDYLIMEDPFGNQEYFRGVFSGPDDTGAYTAIDGEGQYVKFKYNGLDKIEVLESSVTIDGYGYDINTPFNKVGEISGS